MAYFLRQEKKKKGTYLQMYDSYWDKEKKESRTKSVMALFLIYSFSIRLSHILLFMLKFSKTFVSKGTVIQKYLFNHIFQRRCLFYFHKRSLTIFALYLIILFITNVGLGGICCEITTPNF